jgi:multiple sugar transport system substrate-binding protein
MVFVDHSAVPPGQQADFFAGQSAMTLAQLSRVARLKNAPFTWAIVPLPRGPAGDTPVIGQAAISVFNAGKHQAAAIDFVTFMTNKENVMAMAEFFPPARTSILESDAFLRANPLIEPESMQQSVVAAIKKGRVLSTHVEFPLIDLTAQTQFGQLWTPDADVAAIMTEVCEAITPYLHK